MEKMMYQISVERGNGGLIIFESPDFGYGPQKIFITVEQAPLFIQWVQEAMQAPDPTEE